MVYAMKFLDAIFIFLFHLILQDVRGGNIPEIWRRQQALVQLQKALGLPDGRGSSLDHVTPPQFMMELYHSIADEKGITRANNPYGTSIVRSLIEREGQESKEKQTIPGQHIFYFNLTGLGKTERVVHAELHLYQMSSFKREYQVRVYQILEGKPLFETDSHRLLTVGPGLDPGSWGIFNVREAVLAWHSGQQMNLGLLVSTISNEENPLPVSFARLGHDQDTSKQAILVLYNQENKTKIDNHKYFNYYTSTSSRRKRSLAAMTALANVNASTININSTNECTRNELYVDFNLIGWASWIISPKGYSAYQCNGPCTFPLGQSQRPSNHATVQSIVHELGNSRTSPPCCVPTSLLSVSLLYYDEHENVVLKLYEDMVAESCGCH